GGSYRSFDMNELALKLAGLD
nr:Chain D, Engineered Nuclear Export Signal Peptide (PKINES-Flip3 mutant) [Homo sapiens]